MEAQIKRFLYGDGDGSGDGSGYGSGYGSGDGSGSGGGYGYGYRLKAYNEEKVYYIDSIPCVLESVHDNWAAVLIINNDDFTATAAFVAKQDGRFAHGATIRDAFAAVTEKVMDNMDFGEKKASFIEKFPSMTDSYPTMDFFAWHHVITGSCEFGRKQFAQEHGVDLSGTMTVKQFIDLTRSSYGGDRIRELEEMYSV